MLFGCRLDQALQHDSFVAGFEHVVAVAQHDFHLARRVFADQGFGGQALYIAVGIEILEERREVIDVLQVIGLVVLLARVIGLSHAVPWVCLPWRTCGP